MDASDAVSPCPEEKPVAVLKVWEHPPKTDKTYKMGKTGLGVSAAYEVEDESEQQPFTQYGFKPKEGKDGTLILIPNDCLNAPSVHKASLFVGNTEVFHFKAGIRPKHKLNHLPKLKMEGMAGVFRAGDLLRAKPVPKSIDKRVWKQYGRTRVLWKRQATYNPHVEYDQWRNNANIYLPTVVVLPPPAPAEAGAHKRICKERAALPKHLPKQTSTKAEPPTETP